jgi:alkanesulfonate monooxygenase SsuD/methylene tetrahydromethanopterin reductase-like flavin-dependent oxidoreductase (luciferase family)
MHLGMFSLFTQRDRAVSARQLYDEMVEQVKLAEAIGFDIAWSDEHHFSNYCVCPSPLAMALALAPQTTRIRLGIAVIVAPLYHPLRMLEEIGMQDVVSGGRSVVGLGTGYQQYEFHRFGISLETARTTFLETLDVLEQYLSDGPVRYEGQTIRIPETYFVVHPTMRNNVARLDGGFLQEIPTLEEIASRLVVGDPDICAEKLEITAFRPVHISCFMGLPGIPQARMLPSMERFGAEVMPRPEQHFGGLAHIGHPR